MEPTVSVVITTYNYAGFLTTAIESVLAQSLKADEVIVVDDGSTDGSPDVVARYAERGVRYIYKENGGISSARNAGIKASSGELIAFLDADDIWLPDKLALQVEHMRQHPEVGLVTASEWQTGEHGEDPWLLERKPVASANVYRRMLVENFIGNPSLTLIRHEVFRRVGLFDEGVGLGQDWDMWMRIAREFPIGVIGKPLIYYVRHDGSISSGKLWQRYRSNRVLHHRYISKLPSPIERLHVLRSAQSMNLYYTAVGLTDDHHNRLQGASVAAVALLMDPFYKSKLKRGLLLRALLGLSIARCLTRRTPRSIAE